MAYFWSIIATIVLVTGALWANRTMGPGDAGADASPPAIEIPEWRGETDEIAARPEPRTRPAEPAPDPDPGSGPAPDRTPAPESGPSGTEPGSDEPAPPEDDPTAARPAPDPAADIAAAPERPVPEAPSAGDSEPELSAAEPGDRDGGDRDGGDGDGGVGDEGDAGGGEIVIDPDVLERYASGGADPAPDEGAPAETEAAEDPGYTIEPDGTLVIEDGGARVPGSGSADDPYVLSWDLLRGVQRSYAPREGKRELPDWLDALDGRRVLIEGNTLVPVVSKQTSELLVMQNPWDGCCIGVPPSPYDAIEVTLESPVEFGHSATGYGVVRGTFEVDAYEVSGWLMGLFIVSDASYTSGAGEALPDL